MNKLTKREKILLYILACVVIFVGAFYLFINPALNEEIDLKAELNEAKIQKQEMSIKIKFAETLNSLINSNSEEIAALSADLYPMMSNDQIDSIITKQLLKNNLNSSRIYITKPKKKT